MLTGFLATIAAVLALVLHEVLLQYRRRTLQPIEALPSPADVAQAETPMAYERAVARLTAAALMLADGALWHGDQLYATPLSVGMLRSSAVYLAHIVERESARGRRGSRPRAAEQLLVWHALLWAGCQASQDADEREQTWRLLCMAALALAESRRHAPIQSVCLN